MARTVAIVPHTHWDREWYEPFQTFRLRLVELLDELLPRLESDPGFGPFTLDGQMAAVDDYLAVRPEAEPRIRALVAAGRLSVGPWYVLPDEFLVSGETLVRNLELGIERAAAFGGAMEVGYLPDMFGHVAQMPQLLRQAGFEHAVVWRGVPADVDRTAFWWSAPDGSTVRAEYLPVGYSNGAAIPDDAKALISRIRAHEAELGWLLAPESPILWMYGGDHQAPAPWLGRVVAEANDIQQDYRLELTTLQAYLPSAPRTALAACTGELRSGARANLLMGVASNRVDVKQAAAAAERALERVAEPLCALFLPAGEWPAALMRAAWIEVVRNAAHDSVCACSADDVVSAVLHRYTQADQIARGLSGQALAALGRSVAFTGPVVVNSAARSRSGLVEVLLLGDDPVPGTQAVDVRSGAVVEQDTTGAELGTALGHVRNGELARGCDIVGVSVVEAADRLDVVLRAGPPRQGGAAEPGGGGAAQGDDAGVASALSDLYARAGAHREDPVGLRVEYDAYQRVLVRSPIVPGFGWRAWSPEDGGADFPPAKAGPNSMANGLLTVEVDTHDGTFSIDGLAGLDLLVDDGDSGDTYNYSPPGSDVVVDRPVEVRVVEEEAGPVRAALRVTRRFRWPKHIVDDARAGDREVSVCTRLELHAGEHFVRVCTSFDNPSRDHRLRAWFPLPTTAAASRAECAFAVVGRSLNAEGGPHERALPTFPSRRFVSAGGLTLAHEGLLEYELVDGGSALALTLMRCVGLLSGTDLTYRRMAAGPPVAVQAAQMVGPRRFRYAVATGDIDPYAMADDAFLPLLVAEARGGGNLAAEGSALGIEGAEVSAVRRVGKQLEVRVFNPADREATVRFGSPGWRVDLRGRPLGPFEGSILLGPWEIATVRLPES